MMAQLANGGYEIKPRIIDDKYALQSTINAWRKEFYLVDDIHLNKKGQDLIYKEILKNL